MDRLPKRLSERWEEQRQDFESQLRDQAIVPEEAVAVAVSLDGILVPMRDGEGVTKRARTREQGRQTNDYRR
ncbi:hypothetical protein [Chondromyces crocatus]|uniref:hypothetical protein n=1 Tax=Chondromyces crocatus TaxID=52 RepID=UPI00067AF34A|nr:hypothetical protein [Chondromyces crocatus]